MSTHIVIRCERTFRHGTCPQSVYVFGTETVAGARTAAAAQGWHRTDGRDRCPDCSGAGPGSQQIIRVR